MGEWISRLIEAGRFGAGAMHFWPYLRETVRDQREDIEQFAANNVSVKLKEADLNAPLEDIRLWTSAVHFTKARYFRRAVLAEEHIAVLVNNWGGGLYGSSGRFQHDINLGWNPYMRNRLDSDADALRTLDAECSHAHHWNFMHENGVNPSHAANKTLAMITETVDDVKERLRPLSEQGSSFHPPIQFDPYINDFFFFTKKNGLNQGRVVSDLPDDHDEANYSYPNVFYLRCLLSNRESERRKQLGWLIRQKIRTQPDAADELAQEYARRILAIHENRALQTSYWTRDHPSAIDVLLDYYTDRTFLGHLGMTLHDFRDFTIKTTPFSVDAKAGVYLGRKITTFASQLDYVALKLLTSEPHELDRERLRSERAAPA